MRNNNNFKRTSSKMTRSLEDNFGIGHNSYWSPEAWLRRNFVASWSINSAFNSRLGRALFFSLQLSHCMTLFFSVLPRSIMLFWSENVFRRAEKKNCGYWIRLRRNARLCNARSGKVGSSHCYLDQRPLHEIDEIVYEYDRKLSQQLVYVALSRVIFNTLFNIIRVYIL